MSGWFWIKTGLLIAPLAAFLVEFAIVKRFARPCRGTLTVFTVFGLLAAYKFTAFRIFGGNEFNPELPSLLVICWGWVESVIWVGLPMSVSTLLAAWWVRPFRRYTFRTAVMLSLVFATYGMWEGVRVPPVVEKEVTIDGLPSEFDGYRLVHLSDLHCSSAARRGKIAAIVERVNSVRPDLVAITGDFVDGFPRERESDLEPLKDLRAKDGVVACTGNHESYFRIDDWAPFYEKWGVCVLRNDWRDIRRGNAHLTIGGIDDECLGEEPGLVFLGAPSEACRVLMMHRPHESARNAAELGASLQLSGHTHGGAMPIISAFVAKENEGHVRGLYREGRLTLHVSPGTGQWAGFPLRFFNSPEITLLVLRK